MRKGRLEAFSDGVIAILITIMVLELRAPAGAEWSALRVVLPPFLSYLLSFIYLGIYWNNHHHMFQATEEIDGRVLWANLHLLFWLSLVPFATTWLGTNHASPVPTALYGIILLGAAASYTILTRILIDVNGRDSRLARAIGDDRKGWLSLLGYVSAVPLAFVRPWIAQMIFIFIALVWLAPDPRIEHALVRDGEPHASRD